MSIIMTRSIIPQSRGFADVSALETEYLPTTEHIFVYEPPVRSAHTLVADAIAAFKRKCGYAPRAITINDELFEEYVARFRHPKYFTRDDRGPHVVMLCSSSTCPREKLICEG